jgi:Hydantoin racemase
MEKIKIGLINMLTTDNKEIEYSHQKILEECFECFEIITKTIPGQYEGIHDSETLKLAVPKSVKLAEEYKEQGVNVLFMSCCSDPGVKESRNKVNVPVIGAGSACASVALGMGDRVGVIGIEAEIPKPMREILQDKLFDYIRPDDIKTTLDLYDKKGQEKIMKTAGAMKEKGCDVIALGCTGISTTRIHRKISGLFDIPVIDPVLAAGVIISYLGK